MIAGLCFMNKNDMAAAGFYFTGIGDVVRCPFCGVQIGYWEPRDETFSDHKRGSPSCSFACEYFTRNIPIGSDAL
jgi:hypothetical protein